jgi:hypothetical protein
MTPSTTVMIPSTTATTPSTTAATEHLQQRQQTQQQRPKQQRRCVKQPASRTAAAALLPNFRSRNHCSVRAASYRTTSSVKKKCTVWTKRISCRPQYHVACFLLLKKEYAVWIQYFQDWEWTQNLMCIRDTVRLLYFCRKWKKNYGTIDLDQKYIDLRMYTN